MGRFVRLRSRGAVSALVVALAVTFLVNCVPFALATSEARADCPMAEKHACCVSEAERVEQGSVAKPFVLAPPSMVLTAILFDIEPRGSGVAWDLAIDAAVLKLPGVPTYVLDSAFRI